MLPERRGGPPDETSLRELEEDLTRPDHSEVVARDPLHRRRIDAERFDLARERTHLVPQGLVLPEHFLALVTQRAIARKAAIVEHEERHGDDGDEEEPRR